MRLVKRLTVDGAPAEIAEDAVVLRLNGVSAGEFTVRGDWRDAARAPVVLSLGYAAGPMHRVLTGIVTEARAMAGFPVTRAYRLVVRETTGALETPFGAALRHVTPADVLAAIEARTGIEFLLPASSAHSDQAPGEYLMRQQAHIAGLGTCRDTVARMGAIWSVPDAVWFGLPDGRAYWGSWAASPYGAATLEVELAAVLKRDPGQPVWELPVLPRLRPGMAVRADGARVLITETRAAGDRMRVTWAPLPEAT